MTRTNAGVSSQTNSNDSHLYGLGEKSIEGTEFGHKHPQSLASRLFVLLLLLVSQVWTAVDERITMLAQDSILVEIMEPKCKIIYARNCVVIQNGEDDIVTNRQRCLLLPIAKAIKDFPDLNLTGSAETKYQYVALLGCQIDGMEEFSYIYRYDITVYDPQYFVGEIRSLELNTKINSNLHFPYNPENGFFNNITIWKSARVEDALEKGLGPVYDARGKRKPRLDIYPKIQNLSRLLGPQSQDFTSVEKVTMLQFPEYTVFTLDFTPSIPIMYIHPREKSRTDRIAYSGKPSQVLSLDWVQTNRKYLKIGENYILVYGQKPEQQYKTSTCFILVDLARNEYDTASYNSGIFHDCASLDKFGIKGETLMIVCTLQPNPDAGGRYYGGGIIELQLNLNPLVIVGTFMEESQQLLNYTYEDMDKVYKSHKFVKLSTDWDPMNQTNYLVTVQTSEEWKTTDLPVSRVYRLRLRKMTVDDIKNKTSDKPRLSSLHKYTLKGGQVLASCDIDYDVVLWAMSDGSVIGSANQAESAKFREGKQTPTDEVLIKDFCLRKSKIWVLVYKHPSKYWRYLVLNANTLQSASNRVFAEEWITNTGPLAAADMEDEIKFQTNAQLYAVTGTSYHVGEDKQRTFSNNQLMFVWVQFNRRYPMLNLDTSVEHTSYLPCLKGATQPSSFPVDFELSLGGVRGSKTQTIIPVSLSFDCPEHVTMVQLKKKVKPVGSIPLRELVDIKGEVFSVALLQNHTETFSHGVEVRYAGRFVRQFHDPKFGKIGKVIPTIRGMFLMSQSKMRHFPATLINGSVEYNPEIESARLYNTNPSHNHNTNIYGVWFFEDSYNLVSVEIDGYDQAEICFVHMKDSKHRPNDSEITTELCYQAKGYHAIVRDYDFAVMVYDYEQITFILSDPTGHNSEKLVVTTADLNVTSMIVVQDCYITKMPFPFHGGLSNDRFGFGIVSLRRSDYLQWFVIQYRNGSLFETSAERVNLISGTLTLPGVKHGIVQKIECASVPNNFKNYFNCFFGTSSSFDIYVEFSFKKKEPTIELLVKLQKPEQGKVVDIDQCSRGSKTYLYSLLETNQQNVTLHQYELSDETKMQLNGTLLRATRHLEIYDFQEGKFACFGDRFFIKNQEEMIFEHQSAEPEVIFKQADTLPSEFRLKVLGYGYSNVLRFELREPPTTYFMWVYSLAGVVILLVVGYLLAQVWYRLKTHELSDEDILSPGASRNSSNESHKRTSTGSHKRSSLEYWRDRFQESGVGERPSLQPCDSASFKRKLIDSALLKPRDTVNSR